MMLNTVAVTTTPESCPKRDQGSQTVAPTGEMLPVGVQERIGKAALSLSKNLPAKRVPNGKIPIRFLRMLQGHNIAFPGTHGGLWHSRTEILCNSKIWDDFLANIDDLAGVHVQIALQPVPLPNDPMYITPRNADGSQGPSHWYELQLLIRDFNTPGPRGYPYYFADAAQTIPRLVASFKNPPDSCPCAQTIREGAYVASLFMMLPNVTLYFRVHRESKN